MRSLALSIFLYACKIWTITADIERIQALEMRSFRKLLGISCRDYISNEEVKANWILHQAVWRPHFSEKMQTKVVRAHHMIIWTGQDYPTWNSSRRETKRQTEEMMGRQHRRVDWPWMEHHTTERRVRKGVKEAGCTIYSGAPMVSQTLQDR